MTKITLKIERHYGNKDLKTIIENLVSIKFSSFKFNNQTGDKLYYNIGRNTTGIYQEESEV